MTQATSSDRSWRFVAPGQRLPTLLLFLLVLSSSLNGSTGQSRSHEGLVSSRTLSQSLYECYEKYEKWKLIPQNIQNFISIIRKIEDQANMDMRMLAVAILYRFRQDGIEFNPDVKQRPGILPYAPNGEQFYRNSWNLWIGSGSESGASFPNDTISHLERCSLHAMLSSSVDVYARGDESRVCKNADYYDGYRRPYNQGRFSRHARPVAGDREEVEHLSPEQIRAMALTSGGVDGPLGLARTADPSGDYPPYPLKHPANSARLIDQFAKSECPIEKGVLQTPWGSISGGALLAGIAASLQPEKRTLGEIYKQSHINAGLGNFSNLVLDNKFFATLAGDLGEVALVQGAVKGLDQYGQRFDLASDGTWNSTSQPRYYFLNKRENLQMTAAEIRGGIDGLVLGERLPKHYQAGSKEIKLHQILDMYYSPRGLFNRNDRACNRKRLYPEVAPKSTLVTQTHAASLILRADMSSVTISEELLLQFSEQAVNDLNSLLPSMTRDKDCESMGNDKSQFNEISTNVTIVIDASWPFRVISNIIVQTINGLEINKYNSLFTIMNAYDGSIMFNSSFYLPDFYVLFNETHYNKFAKGFHFLTILEKLRGQQIDKLYHEQKSGSGGGKSDVSLFIPYQMGVAQDQRDAVHEALIKMRGQFPDMTVLFLSRDSKEKWTDYVLDREKDIISFNYIESQGAEDIRNIAQLHDRIKQVPRRLINSKCGPNYEPEAGSPTNLDEYISPGSTNFYRIQPNYFFTDRKDNLPKIKIQSSSSAGLNICQSRELLVASNATSSDLVKCDPVTSNTYEIPLDCTDVSYMYECKPYFISITVGNSTDQYSCRESRCRYPNNVKVRISYENLVCRSGANSMLMTPLLLFVVFIQFYN